ncbi:MAG: FecR domain-containing protein [Acidobacteriota bacterium]|nr:FecR domain-containing protein [Acidobacteriota bacterium]
MRRKQILLIAAATLVLAGLAVAGSSYQVVNGPKDFYYGHISLTDIRKDISDPVVQREGKAPEPAVLNLPLGPGDTIRTFKDRRVEIQFDNATIVRLDVDSELKIETILAQGLSTPSKMSNLVLTKGRAFVMYKEYSGRELFQILTPKAAVKFKHNSVGTVGLTPDGATDVQVRYGKATALYGADLKTPKSLVVEAKQRAVFGTDNRFSLADPLPSDAFEAWNTSVNKDFDALHQGKSTLPKPVQRLMPAVFDWAQRFGSHYGEWIFDDYFGYVWRPFYNDVYPWGSWRPYFAGRWTSYNRSMFWVPSEPWGWIPYHLGVWQWSSKRGWYWIPGSAFAPAWVDWAFYDGYWSWRPWSMWDWGEYCGWSWYGSLFSRMYRSGDGYPRIRPWEYLDWGVLLYDTRYLMKPYSPVHGNEASGPTAGDPNYPYNRLGDQARKAAVPLPGDYRAGLRAMLKDLKNGDPAANESFLAQSKSASVVAMGDLLSYDVASKAVPLEAFRASAASRKANDAAGIAPSTAKPGTDSNRALVSQSAEPEVRPGVGGKVENARPVSPQDALGRTLGRAASTRVVEKTPLRTIDWNPDVLFARRMGVQLRYESSRNTIVCPELNLNSANTRFNETNRWSGGSSTGTTAPGGDGSTRSGSSGSGATSTGSSSSGSTTSTTAPPAGGAAGHGGPVK